MSNIHHGFSQQSARRPPPRQDIANLHAEKFAVADLFKVPAVPDLSDQSARILSSFIFDLDQEAHLNRHFPIDSLKLILGNVTKGLGFKYFFYHIVSSPVFDFGNGRLDSFITNYPDAWMNRYSSNYYVNDDPIVTEITKRQLPFIWDDVFQVGKFSDREFHVFAEARDA